MSRSPDGSVAFDFEGCRYAMVFDMKAIAFFEREADVSILDTLASLEAAKEGRRQPKLSHLAMLMQAGLQRHHPGVSLDAAMAMAGSPEVQKALGASVAAAMPDEPVDRAGNAPPPAAARGAKGSTGTGSSKARSKRG